MNRTEEIKKKIEELTDFSMKLKNERESISKKISELNEEIYFEENKEFYESVDKLKGKFIKSEVSDNKYHDVWYIYVDEIVKKEDYIGLKGKSICLVFINKDGVKGQLVTYTYDIDSEYGIEREYSTIPYTGYINFNDIKPSTEVEFDWAKDRIKEIN